MMTSGSSGEIGRDYSTSPGDGEEANLLARLEALLFVAPWPVSTSQLASALELAPNVVQAGLQTLAQRYLRGGLRLQEHSGEYQLTTAPDLAGDIERFLKLESVTRISRAALEVLAIISYRQPVTRPQIDSIRGVNSDTSLRTLLRYGLISEAGRSPGPGRPILYQTSPEFLQHFGLRSLQDLPPLSSDGEAAPPDPEYLEGSDPG